MKQERPGPCGPEPRFQVGARVVVRHIWDSLTTRELLGKRGVVEEVESLPIPVPYWPEHFKAPPAQHNYQVRLDDTEHQHYLNEQMLEPE